MAGVPDGYTITLHDPRVDPDDVLAEVHAHDVALRREILPDEPMLSVAESIAMTRAAPSRYRAWAFRARAADGRLVGEAITSIDPAHDDNPDVLWTGIGVASEHRRRGIGRALLARLVDVAESEGRTRILGATSSLRPAGDAFARAAGGEAKSWHHENRLLIADVDRVQMERWVADAATRSSGYELIGWDGPVPDEHMERWLDLVLVMNTIPHDDLKVNDFTITAEQVRETEQRAASIDTEAWTLVARRLADGEWAGFHDVYWHPFQPAVVEVDSTGVVPAHRGHALGKWLKAAMTRRIMDERPDVAEIRTANADSNDAMLGINREMGYRPWIAGTTWELDITTARRFVDG